MKKIFLTLMVFIYILTIPKIKVSAYGWGVNKNNNHTIPDIGKYSLEIDGTNSYYIGQEKKIYLTFDTGYDTGNIAKILDILNEKNVDATFFCTGDFIEREGKKVKLIVESGQTVGNHTYSHKNITKISESELNKEIEKVEELYYDLIGEKIPNYFRPPYGEFNKKSLEHVKKMGYYTFFWSIAYYDWDIKKQQGVNYTIDSVISNLHDGAIILMHTVSNDNVRALSEIIDEARACGYEFDKLESIIINS